MTAFECNGLFHYWQAIVHLWVAAKHCLILAALYIGKSE